MTEQDRYQIRVRGWIGERWATWFDGMGITYEGTQDNASVTVLTGLVDDQAALRSILTRIWDLNLAVISVNQVKTDATSEGGKSNG